MFSFYNLTAIIRYLTDTENQFYKVLVILVKYQFSIGLCELYWLNIGYSDFYLNDF